MEDRAGNDEFVRIYLCQPRFRFSVDLKELIVFHFADSNKKIITNR